MKSMRFAAFLPPYHPVGEHPTLLFQHDLEITQHLDRLGIDEIWAGEHHSSGWQTMASPELFLAAAAERTQRIKLGTGVISLPYHHPYMVAQRIVQLDQQTRGRVLFGTGPGALTADAQMLGIDTLEVRSRQDEALGIIIRLLKGEEVTHEANWFKLNKGVLQILPYQDNMEIATTATVSPSGMQLAGKYGLGVLSFALPNRSPRDYWAVAEKSAEKHGRTVSRDGWRIRMEFHLAETVRQAEEEAGPGFLRFYNEFFVARMTLDGKGRIDDPRQVLDMVKRPDALRTVVIGTPDEAVKAIRDLYEASGGFGCVLALVHDWANREATWRSWELMARYVIPEVKGLTQGLKQSFEQAVKNREMLMTLHNAAIKKANEAV